MKQTQLIIAAFILIASRLIAAEPPQPVRDAVIGFFPKAAGQITILDAAQAGDVWFLYVDQRDPESASQVIFSYAQGKLTVLHGDYPMFTPKPAPQLRAVPKPILRQFIRAWVLHLQSRVGSAKLATEIGPVAGVTKEVLTEMGVLK